MANNLANSTIRVDTTMTVSYQTTRALPESFSLRIVGMKLIGGSAASSASVADINGNVFATLQCAIGATDSLVLCAPIKIRDFKATITGTGAFLEIYQG